MNHLFNSYIAFPQEYFRCGYSAEFGIYVTSVYLCLLSHRHNKTGLCFPSEKRIADKFGISRTTVSKYIKILIEFNIIKRKIQPSRNGKGVFHYEFTLPYDWKSLDTNYLKTEKEQCTSGEHNESSSNYDDVHLMNDQCSFENNSDVHEMNTNNKKLTRRNNNILDKENSCNLKEKKLPYSIRDLPHHHPAVRKWVDENSD